MKSDIVVTTISALHSARRNDGIEHRAYLIVCPWKLESVGGVSVAVRGLLEGLRESEVAAPLLVVNNWPDRLPRVGLSGQEKTIFLRIPEPIGHGGLFRSLFNSCVSLPISAWHLGRLLRKERVSVVDFHYPGLHCVGALALRTVGLYKGVVALSFHGQDIRSVAAERSRSREWLWRRVARCADLIFVCSSNLVSEATSALRVPATRVRVTHNGISAEAVVRAARRACPPVAIKRPFIVCLATFEHKKGLDLLLRAFSRIAEEIREIDLVITGRNGPEFAAIQSLVDSLGLGARVRLLTDTPHEQALALLAQAVMLVQPSRLEPFGIALLEAAVLGVPAVCTNVCGALESLPAGAVIAVPTEDIGQLALAMRETILNLESARARAAETGRYVERNLSWSIQAAARVRLAADSVRIS